MQTHTAHNCPDTQVAEGFQTVISEKTKVAVLIGVYGEPIFYQLPQFFLLKDQQLFLRRDRQYQEIAQAAITFDRLCQGLRSRAIWYMTISDAFALAKEFSLTDETDPIAFFKAQRHLPSQWEITGDASSGIEHSRR